MAEDKKVTIEELLISHTYEIAAIAELLEEKGLLSKQEVFDKIEELKELDSEAAGQD